MIVPRGSLRFAAILFVCISLNAAVTAQTKRKVAPAPAVAGPTTIKVDGNVIKSYIEFMAAPDKEGRKSLTPGFERTAEWAAAKFKEWGLKPAGDNGTYLQDVPITGRRTTFAWTTGIPVLTVDGRIFYMKDNDFVLDSESTPGTQASNEVVFAGYGISAPGKGLDEYAAVDVKDKIVLAFKGSPKDAPAARGMFGINPPEPKNPEPWTEESTDRAKIKTAYEKGAAAILLFSPDKLALSSPFGGQQQPTMAQMFGMGREIEGSPYTRPFLVVTDVNERVFRQVMWRDPQESARGFVGRIDQIRRDIRDKKARSQAAGVGAQLKGYTTTQYYGEKFKNNTSHNVIGKIEGADPSLAGQYILIGGHLDHVGTTNGVIYNGADDDASGAATTMEMGRLFAANASTIKPKRTVIFALWCGEEMGLLGSNYYAKSPSDGVKIDNIVANFNLDMVGLGERIGAPGGLNFPAVFDVIMKHQDPDVAKVVDASTGGPGGSDHSAFIQLGIESLALMTSGGVGHPDYHDSGDRTEKIDPEILRKTGQFVLQGTINLATEMSTTLPVPDRLHLYNGMRLTPLNLEEARAGGGRGFMGAQPGPQGPRFNISLSDSAAFGGSLTLIDMAAKMLSVGRVEVSSRGDGQWFSSNGLTERGRAAVKAFETNGMVIHLNNPSDRLLSDLLEAAGKPFIVSNLGRGLEAAAARRINEKNVLFALPWDAAAPDAVAATLIDLKKLIGDSDNLLLTTQLPGPSALSEMGLPDGAARPGPDVAKQKLYLALIRAGWTKDEIYAMVGVSPARPGPMEMPPAAPPRLGGNLAKLSQ